MWQFLVYASDELLKSQPAHYECPPQTFAGAVSVPILAFDIVLVPPVNGSQLSLSQKNDILQFCQYHADLFAREGRNIGFYKDFEHRIDSCSYVRADRRQPYRYAAPDQTFIENQTA